MSATLPEQEEVFIQLTPEALTRLDNIMQSGKTPIIKIEDTIYHPIALDRRSLLFINPSNQQYLYILKESSSPPAD